MGLTLKRIAFGALVLAAVLLPLRHQRASDDVNTLSPLQQRWLKLVSLYRDAQRSASAFEYRDSAAEIAATAKPGTPVPAVLWRGFPAGTQFNSQDTTLTTFWSKLGNTDARVSVSVMYVNGTHQSSRAYDGAYISRHGDRIDCVAIVPGYTLRSGLTGSSPTLLQNELAPCALLAKFGPPGRGVGDWLDATRFALASSNRWFAPPRRRDFPPEPWTQWGNTTVGFSDLNGIVSATSVLGVTGLLDIAVILTPRYEFGSAGLRCLEGDPAFCPAGIVHPDLVAPDSSRMPRELVLDAYDMLPSTVTLSTVRPPGESFTAALITQFGVEKFTRFWQSNRTFDAAFLGAFGQSLESWSARWTRDIWLGTYEAQHVNANILLGVTVNAATLPPVLLWTAVSLAIAGMVARRRTA